MTNRLMALLEELGLCCDTTIEPGHRSVRGLVETESSVGSIPGYRTVPRHPYRPSLRNFRRPGRFAKRSIWELPVSTGRPRGAIQGLSHPPPRCLAMTLGLPFPAMQQLLDQNLSRGTRPGIVAACRSDVTTDQFNREQFELFLSYLAEHPLRDRFVFSTPIETVRLMVPDAAIAVPVSGIGSHCRRSGPRSEQPI